MAYVVPLEPAVRADQIDAAAAGHCPPRRVRAVAGADAIVSASFEGPGRFNAVKKFTQSILENSIATGDLEIPFSGPHFFCAFTFYNESSEEGCFPPATVFVPRWQVSRSGRKYGERTAFPILVMCMALNSLAPGSSLPQLLGIFTFFP